MQKKSLINIVKTLMISLFLILKPIFFWNWYTWWKTNHVDIMFMINFNHKSREYFYHTLYKFLTEMLFHIVGWVCHHILEKKLLNFINNTVWKKCSTAMICFPPLKVFQHSFPNFPRMLLYTGSSYILWTVLDVKCNWDY